LKKTLKGFFVCYESLKKQARSKSYKAHKKSPDAVQASVVASFKKYNDAINEETL
jgi:hypothetical protein